MDFSQEIINVLDYLANSIGIVIDWTSENVAPMMMELMNKYRLYAIWKNLLFIFVMSALLSGSVIILIKIYRAYANLRHKNDHSSMFIDEEDDMLSLPGYTAVFVGGSVAFASFLSLYSAVLSLLEWIVIPEIAFLEVVKSLAAGG